MTAGAIDDQNNPRFFSESASTAPPASQKAGLNSSSYICLAAPMPVQSVYDLIGRYAGDVQKAQQELEDDHINRVGQDTSMALPFICDPKTSYLWIIEKPF